MALPVGIETRIIVVSPAAQNGPRRASLEVLIEPSEDVLVWVASGAPVVLKFPLVRTTPEQSAVLHLPTVDQIGFVDKDSLPINNWHYKITVRYLVDGRKVGIRTVKFVQPVSTDPLEQDFDFLPSGQEGLVRGPQGPRGFSPYELAVQNGFVGTVEEWLESLRADSVAGEMVIEAVNTHVQEDEPHPTYDNIPSLTLLFENGLV